MTGDTTHASATLTSLVRMANQIAANYRYLPPDQAATQVEAHLRAFWTPRMRTELLAFAEAGGGQLEPVVRSALARLGARS